MSAKDHRVVASIAVFAPLAISLAISLGAMELFSVLSVLWGGVIFLKFRPVFADTASKRNFLTTMFLAVAFSLCCIAPLLTSAVPEGFVIDALRQSKWMLYCVCAGLLITQLGENLHPIIQWSLILGLLVAGSVGLIQAVHGEALAESGSWLVPQDLHFRGMVVRATGFFNLPQAFAGVLGMLALILLPQCLGMDQGTRGDNTLRSGLALLATSLGFLCVLASGTRGAYVALLCSLISVILIMLKYRLMRGTLALLLCGLSCVALLGLFLIAFDSFELLGINAVTADASFQVRASLTHAYLAMVSDRPLLGSGLSYSASLLPEYYQKIGALDADFVGHAHSNYLQALVDGGVLGLGSYLALIFCFLRWNVHLFLGAGDQNQQRLFLGLLAAQLYFHVFGLLESNFIDLKVNHTLIFVWGLIIGIGGFRPRLYERGDAVVSEQSR